LQPELTQTDENITITFATSGSCHDDDETKILIGLLATCGIVALLGAALGLLLYFHKKRKVRQLEIFFWKLE
jgi:hypothetical protein